MIQFIRILNFLYPIGNTCAVCTSALSY